MSSSPTGSIFATSKKMFFRPSEEDSQDLRSSPTFPPHQSPSPNFEHLRLQQLYTLALADRMRFLHNPVLPFINVPSSPTTLPPPPPPLHLGGGSGPGGPGSSQAAMAHLSQLAAAAMAAAAGSSQSSSTVAASQLQSPTRSGQSVKMQLPASSAGGSPGQVHPSNISDFPQTHPLSAYYGKFDPRLFRMSDEPKPQHSYIGLISMAILNCPEMKLVLADIYQYILDNFSYFRHRGPGWRNSIRHNLSLNDCFIKAGRAANGKGHYWAIHPACIEDFKRGDYRRRKAQRKVRRHMGLAVDDEDSPSPPPPPFAPPGTILPLGWPTVTPAGVRIPPPIIPHPLHPHQPHHVPHHPLPLPASFVAQNSHIFKNQLAEEGSGSSFNGEKEFPTRSSPATSPLGDTKVAKKKFDVASLLGGDLRGSSAEVPTEKAVGIFGNKRPCQEDTGFESDDLEEPKRQRYADLAVDEDDLDHEPKKSEEVEETGFSPPKLDNNNDHDVNSSNSDDESSSAAAERCAGKKSPMISPQEYLARYYQLMHQQQLAAEAAISAASSSSFSKEDPERQK